MCTAQVSSQKENIERSRIEVHYQSKSGATCCKDRDYESFIKSICDEVIASRLHPRTSILVSVIERHDDGCLLPCAVNATVTALIDAGIPMNFLAAAAMCAVDEDGQITIDPNRDAVEASVATVTVVLDSENRQLLAAKTSGSLSSKTLNKCISDLTDSCTDIFVAYKSLLTNNVYEG